MFDRARFIEVTEEEREYARRQYGKSAEDVKKDCELIRDWMKQQAHFPDDYDQKRIEYFLLRNKFRVERTKEKLENYYTVRGENIEFLQKMDPQDDRIQHFFTSITMAVSPKLFNRTERVCYQRYTPNDDAYSLEENLLLIIAVAELECLYDYAAGMRVIVDFEHFTMTHLKKMNDISLISKMLYMYQDCLSGRFIAIHIINAPTIFNMLLDVLKLAMPQKLYKKMIVHQSVDSLRDLLTEKHMPSDYGGQLPSYNEMHDFFKVFIAENRDHIMKRSRIVADERKRVGPVRTNELFGTDGTFKKMNID